MKELLCGLEGVNTGMKNNGYVNTTMQQIYTHLFIEVWLSTKEEGGEGGVVLTRPPPLTVVDPPLQNIWKIPLDECRM